MKFLNKMNLGNILAILLGMIGIAIILTMYYLINQSQDNSFEKNIQQLNQLQQQNAKWSVAILESQRYRLQDFDAISSYIVQISKQLEQLEEAGFLSIKKVGEKTVNAFQIYESSFDLKSQAVEHYKSEQAILRNSVIYLPKISNILQQLLTTKKKKEGADLKQALITSNLLINQFLLTKDLPKNIKATLSSLKTETKKLDSNIEKKMESYITHARIIIQYKPKVEQMLERAMSIDFGQLTNEVMNAYSNHQDSLNQEVNQFQKIMLAGVFLLLISMLWFLIKLKKSTSKIASVDSQKQVIEKQLRDSEQEVGNIKKDILLAERHRASGDLAIGTFNELQMLLPVFSEHFNFLNQLKENSDSVEYKDKAMLLDSDLKQIQQKITELYELIDDKKNITQQIAFDFNQIALKAIETATNEFHHQIQFTKQFGTLNKAKGSPVDFFQILIKLFRQAGRSYEEGGDAILVKTWKTDDYANMLIHIPSKANSYFSEESLVAINKLSDVNQGKFKFTQHAEGKGVVWISFPLY